MADVFWLNKADFQPVAKVTTALEMAYALRKAPKEVVFHHLTAKKNDFANWALNSLKNPDLAAKLSEIRHTDLGALEKLIVAFEGKPEGRTEVRSAPEGAGKPEGRPEVKQTNQEKAQAPVQAPIPAKMSAPGLAGGFAGGFPSKSAKELDSNRPHPQAEELKRQSALSSSSTHSIGPFNLPRKKK